MSIQVPVLDRNVPVVAVKIGPVYCMMPETEQILHTKGNSTLE